VKVITSCILLFLSAILADAVVIFSDSFTYPDGALTNVAAGVWIEHSAGTPLQVISGQAQISSSLSEDVHAALTNQPYTTGGGTTLYASFTVSFTSLPTAGGSYFANFNSSGSFRCLVWASTVNAVAGSFRLGVGNTTAATAASGQLPTDLALNTPYTIVIRCNVGMGQSTLWLNPASEADVSVSASDTTTAVSISNFSLRQASGEGTLRLDNLIIGTSFSDVVPGSPGSPIIITQPQSQTVNPGDNATFSVVVNGTSPFSYQWSSNSVSIIGATNAIFTLTNATDDITGSSYFVTISNALGSINSQTAILTVKVANGAPTNGTLTYLTYNVDGNSITDTDPTNWAVAAPQVQAIGRQLVYLHPDVITFNEIPSAYKWQMTNWVAAFLPGYYLAGNSASDGFIQNYVASRYPINRSKSWLSNSSLTNFGYNGKFPRDLFEAEIAVPNYPLPLHIFITHLKATDSDNPQSNADERAAQCSSISNFFATTFLPGTNGSHPYILSGDLNESAFLPDKDYVSGHPIQRLTSPPTGLQLTDPVNPITHTNFTESIRGPLNTRFDYILPCSLMFSNLVSSQVFRTDLLNPLPPNLNNNDDKMASDHLPVVMVFANPFDTPFQLLSITRTNESVTLKWESQNNRTFNIEASANLFSWTPFVTNLLATTTNSPFIFSTNNVASPLKFFRIYRVP
jgi:endonuclease/exonuclease/phosphatase family metal-dependent hydrolase